MLKYNRDDILKDLRVHIVEVTFTKADGTVRVMRCSLKPEYLPATYVNDMNEEKEFHHKNLDVISAWDVEKSAWRSFRIDTVHYCQVIDVGY